MTIDELNKVLCGLLDIKQEAIFKGMNPELCPHDISLTGCREKCLNGEKDCGVDISLYPNLLAQITIQCERCGGTGTYHHVYITLDDKPNKTAELPCPCKGQPRLITRLQKELEERGEWEGFVIFNFMNSRKDSTNTSEQCQLKQAVILTDAYQLGMAYKEFKEG